MKTLKNLNVYQCEFCGKKGLSASHIARHEKYCPKNPEVATMCAECGNLERIKMIADVNLYDDFGAAQLVELRMFRCKATGKKLYSKQIERKATQGYASGAQLAKGIIKHSDEPMPLKKDGCGHFRLMNIFDDFNADWEHTPLVNEH